jgi:hypothetical protein
MYRLQYRNFGTYQTIVASHTVDVNSTDRAGIRWYELRNSGAGWSIFQQGTFSPDATHRWMGSAAMDGSGNIGIGYSASSGTMFPAIRYTGRLAGDPVGQLPQGEGTIINGTGAQTHTASRWGDYSSLSVDPVDGCTLWFTSEYIQTTGSAPWRTRIGSFKLPGCGGGPTTGTLQGTVTDATSSAAINGATVTIVGGASTTTNASGFYQFTNVAAGTYSVTAAKTGYATGTNTGVVVTAGGTTTSDFALTPATTTSTGYLAPTSQAAQTSSAGDNNGFQTNPANALNDNSVFAVDTNSGTNKNTSCTNAGKDKHNFFNYNFSLPPTAAIQGIAVRLDARADATAGAPSMCVQISWDGGATWTTAKQTSTLTTSEVTYTLGGTADTWGRTWAPANFTNANFRVRVIDVSSNNTRDFSLDYIAVNVTYQP